MTPSYPRLLKRPLRERRKWRTDISLRALLACLTLLAASAAVAADALTLRPGMGGVPDPGAIDCEYFNELYPNSPTGFRQTLLYWTEGYIFAKSGKTIDEALAAAPPAARPWTFDTLTDHLVNHCLDHPESRVPAAVDGLWQRLQPAAQP